MGLHYTLAEVLGAKDQVEYDKQNRNSRKNSRDDMIKGRAVLYEPRIDTAEVLNGFGEVGEQNERNITPAVDRFTSRPHTGNR